MLQDKNLLETLTFAIKVLKSKISDKQDIAGGFRQRKVRTPWDSIAANGRAGQPDDQSNRDESIKFE